MIKTYALIITMAIFIRFVLYLVSTYLNIINIRSADFSKIRQNYTFTEFTRSSLYTMARSRFEIVGMFFVVITLMLFWMLYGFTGMEMLVSLCSDNVVIEGIIYWFVMLALLMFVRNVGDAFLTFVIEQKFGFNSMTWRTWFRDKFIEAGLVYAVALPIISLLLVIFYTFSVSGWWIAWIVFGAILFFVEMIYPRVYLRLFFKFTPIENMNLHEKIMAFCKKIDLPVSAIYVVNGSKRTRRVNASFIGLGKSRTIILYDNILENFTDDEIICIIGHEAGHFKHNHFLIDTLLKIVAMGVGLYWYGYFSTNVELFQSFFVYSTSFYSGLAFCILLCAIPDLLISPLYNTFLRRLQLNADMFSVHATHDKASTISALKKLSVKNMNNPLPHRFYVALYYTQYSIEQRIKAVSDEKID